MKKITGRTGVVLLCGAMAAGMLTGCGSEKKLDGTKTVATIDGKEINMGLLSLAARHQQSQTEALYMSFMGSISGIWDSVADEESGETYGQQTVNSVLERVELMHIMEDKASEYDVAVTSEEESQIAEAAKSFMEENSEEVLEELACTEDDVKRYLTLNTIYEKERHAIEESAEVNVTDEEAQQSAFSYVSISLTGEELTDEDIEKRKEDAKAIEEKMLADPSADMDAAAKEVDESYSSYTGTFFTNENADNPDTYDENMMTVLRSLSEGEVGPEVIETDSTAYIVRLDKEFDEEATESRRTSLENAQRTEYFTELTDGWLADAEVKVEDKVLSALVISDTHNFNSVQDETEAPAETTEAAAAVTTEAGAAVTTEAAAAGTTEAAAVVTTEAGTVETTEAAAAVTTEAGAAVTTEAAVEETTEGAAATTEAAAVTTEASAAETTEKAAAETTEAAAAVTTEAAVLQTTEEDTVQTTEEALKATTTESGTETTTESAEESTAKKRFENRKVFQECQKSDT